MSHYVIYEDGLLNKNNNIDIPEIAVAGIVKIGDSVDDLVNALGEPTIMNKSSDNVYTYIYRTSYIEAYFLIRHNKIDFFSYDYLYE